MVDAPKYVYQSLSKGLHDHGVTTIFGLMGDANLFLIDHYVRAFDGKFIAASHEGNAVLMALASAQVTGEVAVATCTQGPALTNCMTALIEGVKGRIPIVLMTGDTPKNYPQHIQNADQLEIVKASGAGFEQLRSPATANKDLARAMQRARVERRPVVFNMPVDFMWAEAAYEHHVLEIKQQTENISEGPELDNAIGIIASARRPLILAGAGALEARNELISLSERLQAPLATTLKAKGLIKGHPNDIGIFGTLSTPGGYEVMSVCDCICSFGSGLQDFTTDKGRLLDSKRVVQIDSDASAIGKNRAPDAALVADVKLAANNIIWWLDEAEIAPSGFSLELDENAAANHPTSATIAKAGYVNYVNALERLEEALPQDRILVTDGGRFMTEVWARISVPDPRSFVFTANFGSIGLGLQEAIGAATAAPERTSVLFTGDGGFMMGGINELNTAVRANLDLVIIVANDSAYGAEHIQFVDRKMDPSLSEFDWPSFSEVAKSLGAEAVSVNCDTQLDKALELIHDHRGPWVIELCLHPADVPRMRA